MWKTTSARLFGTLLGYIILIILLLTLNPFYFAPPDELLFSFYSGRSNIINNILLFLPVGFLYRLTTKRRDAYLFGGLLSLSIEFVQFFIPARTPSVPDILANTAGAWLGGAIYHFLTARVLISQGIVGRLRLETPLMGLIYLLTPLLWINILALNEAPSRWLLTLLLGICGAIIFSNLFRHWWKVVDWRVTGYAFLAAGAWFSIGAGPGILSTSTLLATGLGTMLLAALLTILPQASVDRRFERSTLRITMPVFVLYLFLLALFFPLRAVDSWHAIFGFTDRLADTSLESLYSRVEQLAAFTVLGYMIAEWRGRLERSFREELPALFLFIVSSALVLEFLSGFQAGGGASLVRLLLSIAGALFGAMIYHMSRAHVRFLLGR
jgi:VanZ family protein